MNYYEIVLLAYALSIDACVVSFSYGLTFSNNFIKNSLKLSLTTSLFQAFMPIIGYFLTNLVKDFIQPYASWIVFSIFIYLGIRFIYEAYQTNKEKHLCLDAKCLLLLGIATSIDAFSAGISLSLMGNHILKPAILIGLVTFINAITGYFIGNKIRHLSTRNLEIIAGMLLLLLGIKAVI